MSLVRVISDVEGIDVLSLKSSLRREVMELDELRKRFESVIRSMTLVDSELRRMPEEMINHSFEATKLEEQTISGAAEKEMFAAATAAALAGEGPAGAALTDTETLRRLQDENEITTVSIPGSADRYELASVAATHHHHFHCTVCDRIYDVAGCAGGLKKLLPEGFKLEHHELTLSGRCAACP